MLIRQSQLFGKARREAPADAQAAGHRLLARAGYIDQLASGIFSLLPLGWRVHQSVARIVREEMERIGGQELLLPALHPAPLWLETNRLATMDPPLFTTRDRHDRELVLASTHEEAITDLARRLIASYKDLPLAVFQIQTKFRNELRASGGLLRVREFVMKDLYSFHRTEQDLGAFYERVQGAYTAIFRRCELPALVVSAQSGPIGGSISHEFSIPAEAGEDTVAVCPACGFAHNVTDARRDIADARRHIADAPPEASVSCPRCGTPAPVQRCIEAGHTFQLGTKYSAAMGALYTEEDGSRAPLIMGCYGIGIGRVVAAIAELHHDEKGLVWPEGVAPFPMHVIALQPSVRPQAEALAGSLAETHDVLLDDRDSSPGEKLVESDLLGIPLRIIVSVKNQASNEVEVTHRLSKKVRQMPVQDLLEAAATGRTPPL